MNWDYIAGFIDGEGSILINPPRVRIYISNTNKPILIEIKNFLKCGTIFDVKRKENKNWSKQYMFVLSNHKDCLIVLQHLKNKLIIKKDKCQEAINYISNKRWQGDYLSKEELIKLKHLSYRKIAKQLGVSHYCVFRYLRKYGIK